MEIPRGLASFFFLFPYIAALHCPAIIKNTGTIKKNMTGIKIENFLLHVWGGPSSLLKFTGYES